MAYNISLHSTDPLLMEAEAHTVDGHSWLTIKFRDSKDLAREDYQWPAGGITVHMYNEEFLAVRIADAINSTISKYKAEHVVEVAEAAE